jgi:hypothetical protein
VALKIPRATVARILARIKAAQQPRNEPWPCR